MAPTVEERRLRMLVSKKEKLFQFIQKIYDLTGDLGDERSRGKFLSLIGSLEKVKSELVSLVDEVMLLQSELDEKFEPNYDILDSVYEMCGHIRLAERSLNSEGTGGNGFRGPEGPSGFSARLPKIELPTFAGEIREWEQFYDLFKSLVHENSKISNMDKLYYLMGCLKGPARNICSGLSMSAENYEVVWDALIQRYHDTRALANAYLGQILDWRDSREESEKSLNSFLEKFDASVRALRNLRLRDLADFMFLYHALSRLNPETVNYFEINRNSTSVPQYEELVDFVKLRVKTLATTRPKSFSKPKELDGPRVKGASRAFLVNEKNIAEPRAGCGYCGRSGHETTECKGFISLKPYARYMKVKELNLCYNCLSADHGVRNCPSAKRCESCQLKHHSLVHHERSEGNSAGPAAAEKDGVLKKGVYSAQNTDEATVLLGTVEVEVEGPLGGGEGRFLLDCGSQANLVSHSFCRKLGLPISKLPSSVQGLGGIIQVARGQTTFTVRSRFDKGKSFPVTALVMERITGKLPQSHVNLKNSAWLDGLPLADLKFPHPGAVEGIFGAEIFSEIVGTHHRKGSDEGPMALETSLGYVVLGRIPAKPGTVGQRTFVSIVETPPVEELVRRFWEVEAVAEADLNSGEDDPCEEIFQRESFRDETGRFTVALPFKVDPCQLGDSRRRARKRFFALEGRLERSPEMKEAYHKAMADFIDQGHLVPVVNQPLETPAYYIPHHAVYKASSESTPVRIVLDASAPSDNGLSLNAVLHCGPKLQADIGAILIYFRLFPVALVSDIRQMYRQIDVVQHHRKFQRLFWRWGPEEPLKLWELRTLAFGVTSSPYLALRCVREVLQEGDRMFPKTAGLVRGSLYMDDLVLSVPSLEESEEVYSESVELFRRGHFELTKWNTNSEELLEKIPVENRAKGDRIVTFGSETSILGVMWDPRTDKILVQFPVPSTECTKRAILSSVARCFDPLGLTAPLILYLKVLVKELWTSKLDWDEQAPRVVQQRWERIHAEWSSLRRLEIKRSFDAGWDTTINLFGFSDASKDGYGGVVYLQRADGDSGLQLICAKSRVSPVKVMTIPRLELSAALLLTRLLAYVSKTLSKKIRVAGIFAFSDSSTVLQWLSGESSKDTFVRNRVTQIKEILPAAKWKHISGRDNPADGLSRGLSPVQLVDHKTWFEGPWWVNLPEEEWPCLSFDPSSEAGTTLTTVKGTADSEEEHPLLDLIERKSSWAGILRTTVWVLRWLRILPKRSRMAVSDFENAERILVMLVQKRHFGDDLERLQNGREPSHRLRRLQPFLHQGVLRVGGRLSNARLPFNQSHQLILPGKCRLTERLVDYHHRKHFHAGAYLVETFLRQNYWILGAKSVIKKRVRACNRCFRCNPKTAEARMADLPEQRVTPAKAFLRTGVDYFGPISITLGRRRGAVALKAYVALFVCMSVKAIHLEVVSSLSTDHFLQAFKRFLARRGPCTVIYSDRGTNFVGARKVLADLAALVDSDDYNKAVGNELLERGVDWRFNPAGAPHMGGLWESQVKVVKRHLLRVIGEQLLSYEELNTLLVQVEGLLNSRPLCQLSTDPSAPSALTPAHFLHQAPLEFLPAENLLDTNVNHLNRFQLLDHMVQSFWKRWRLEYLTTLQIRQKWHRGSENVRVGTVVLLKIENIPPLRWPLGVVTEVFPGRDGIVRSVRVRCGQKDLVRPVVKICPLPSQ